MRKLYEGGHPRRWQPRSSRVRASLHDSAIPGLVPVPHGVFEDVHDAADTALGTRCVRAPLLSERGVTSSASLV